MPRLEHFVASWERDTREGITLRGVQNQVVGVRNDFDKHQTEMRDRVRALEVRKEEQDRQAQNEALAGRSAGDTGPHPQIPQMAIATPVQPFPTSFQQPIPPTFPGQWPPQVPSAYTPAFGTQVPSGLQAPERQSQAHIVVETKERESTFISSVWKKLKKYLSHSLAALMAVGFYALVDYMAAHGCNTARQVQRIETPAAASSK